MKREGRNLASAVMALVHLDHESHSTFRSGSCQTSTAVREVLAGLVELTERANLLSGHAVKAELFNEGCRFE